MIKQFLAVFALFCEGALQIKTTCNDPEINDDCLTLCRLEYVTCRQNCDSTFCESACSAVYSDCNRSCPCGADCPAGCVDCPEHPFCEHEVENINRFF
ncbi:unnamed protein product [Oikopleura dioica]|uniref:4Fe-4S ferredoxin-type domain-containing protein n=1 Tax=Oikopleura dioica TaxID=34765 RepID=E4YEK3_OIKDI|nr:unnamed protein product [Oikopleura dioica]